MSSRSALVLVGACATPQPAGPPPLALPAYRQLDGAATLPELLRGKPAVIDVFATWCEPCRDAVPELNALAAAHPELVVVGVDSGDPRGNVRRFVAETGLAYPVFLDEDQSFTEAAGVTRIPTLLVLDRAGRVVHRSHRLDRATRAAVDRVLLGNAERPEPHGGERLRVEAGLGLDRVQ